MVSCFSQPVSKLVILNVSLIFLQEGVRVSDRWLDQNLNAIIYQFNIQLGNKRYLKDPNRYWCSSSGHHFMLVNVSDPKDIPNYLAS